MRSADSFAAFDRLFVRRQHQVCGFSVSRQRRVDAADFERRSIEVRRLGRTFGRPSMIRKSGSRFSEKIRLHRKIRAPSFQSKRLRSKAIRRKSFAVVITLRAVR
jgi:hypothetical protein